MFAHTDPETRKTVHPKLELVRLAIPRRVYTQSHFDYATRIISKVGEDPKALKGYKITYQPELMRHFTAKFSPLV